MPKSKVDRENAPKKDKAEARRPEDVHVYPNWCKQCGICTAFCPTGALEKGPDGRPVWAHPERCIGCGICELRCPDFAIEVIEKKESADESTE